MFGRGCIPLSGVEQQCVTVLVIAGYVSQAVPEGDGHHVVSNT